MRYSRVSFLSLIVILSGSFLTAVLLQSCRKEIPVEPVEKGRNVSGQVVDMVTRLGIPGATVTVSPPGRTAVTDASGYFSVPGVPVVPSPRAYQVYATAPGYTDNGIVVNCNCLALNAGQVPLRRLGSDSTGSGECRLVLSPDPIDFGTVDQGQSVSRGVTVTNPTAYPVTITSISLSPPSSEIAFQGLPSLPLSLGAGATRTFQLVYTPGASDGYIGAVVAATNCTTTLFAASVIGTRAGAYPQETNGVEMNRWLPRQNASWMYHGVRFPASSELSFVPYPIIDSINVCGIPGIPAGRFGRDSADFQFLAIDSTRGLQGHGFIVAAKGLQKLGNTVADQKTFRDYASVPINPAESAWMSGCGVSFNENDVIVVRTRDSRWFLVLLKKFFIQPKVDSQGRVYNWDTLTWSYIPR